jgi:small subunit ribosomal protein S21
VIIIKSVCNVCVKQKYEHEPLDKLLKRFKKQCDKADLKADLRKHDYYLSPSEKRKLKSKLAQQRLRREESRKNRETQKWLKKQKDLKKKNSEQSVAVVNVTTQD